MISRCHRVLSEVVVMVVAILSVACQRPPAEKEAPQSVDPSRGPKSETGDSLKRVTLSPAAVAAAGIRAEPVRAMAGLGSVGTIEAPGQVEADPARVAVISPRAPGRLERLTAVLGDQVRAGQVVAYVQSPAYLGAQADYRQAVRRAVLLEGTGDSTGAKALARAARDRLILFGASDSSLRAIEAGAEPTSILPVTAPFTGSLVEGMALAGVAVEPGTPIFRLIDLSEVDIAAQVPERFLPMLRLGLSATILIAAYPDAKIEGRVERIKDELEPTTRTIEAVIHARNPNRTLRPGMFATALLDVDVKGLGTTAASMVVVPESAVLADGAQRYVFIEVGSGSFERRIVEVHQGNLRAQVGSEARVMIKSGVAPGERVVVAGAFTLKSELAKAAFAEED
jgi:RND family efflux transporter MFP subunit